VPRGSSAASIENTIRRWHHGEDFATALQPWSFRDAVRRRTKRFIVLDLAVLSAALQQNQEARVVLRGRCRGRSAVNVAIGCSATSSSSSPRAIRSSSTAIMCDQVRYEQPCVPVDEPLRKRQAMHPAPTIPGMENVSLYPRGWVLFQIQMCGHRCAYAFLS
jgi:hypothetical protein